jgi:hypothetical protein
MRYTKHVVIEKDIEVYKCDYCDKEVEKDKNQGCCGTAPMKWCDFCGKECCSNHRKLYWENEWEDYPDFCACQDCIEKVDKCEYIARQVAGRYDGWFETVKKVHDNFDDYQPWLEDYEPRERAKINMEDLYDVD